MGLDQALPALQGPSVDGVHRLFAAPHAFGGLSGGEAFKIAQAEYATMFGAEGVEGLGELLLGFAALDARARPGAGIGECRLTQAGAAPGGGAQGNNAVISLGGSRCSHHVDDRVSRDGP